jgi:hypothetical protein
MLTAHLCLAYSSEKYRDLPKTLKRVSICFWRGCRIFAKDAGEVTLTLKAYLLTNF